MGIGRLQWPCIWGHCQALSGLSSGSEHRLIPLGHVSYAWPIAAIHTMPTHCWQAHAP